MSNATGMHRVGDAVTGTVTGHVMQEAFSSRDEMDNLRRMAGGRPYFAFYVCDCGRGGKGFADCRMNLSLSPHLFLYGVPPVRSPMITH